MTSIYTSIWHTCIDDKETGSTKLIFQIAEKWKEWWYPVEISIERCGKWTDDDVADAFSKWLKDWCIKSLFALIQELISWNVWGQVWLISSWIDQLKDIHDLIEHDFKEE